MLTGLKFDLFRGSSFYGEWSRARFSESGNVDVCIDIFIKGLS